MRRLTQNLAHMRVVGESSIDDFLDDFQGKLNNILFETDTVQEAAAKIKKLKPRVDGFFDQLKTLGN